MRRRLRGLLASLRDYLLRAEPRRPVSGWSLALDSCIAAAATAVAIAETLAKTGHGRPLGSITENASLQIRVLAGGSDFRLSAGLLAGVILTTAPLAVRRRDPLAASTVIVAGLIGTHHVPAVTFGTAVLAVYSAVVYSPYRQLAVAVAAIGGIVSTVIYASTTPNIPARYTALIVIAPTLAAGLGVREWRQRASDSAARLRRAQAEHETDTERALVSERARIAAELHDVVTHNVSVMMVQAGAAEQILEFSAAVVPSRGDPTDLPTDLPADLPTALLGEARDALAAVQASGRTAMAELRALLGLLSPGADGEELFRPQPGLADLGALIDRVSAAGVPVELHTTGLRGSLPPGLDLAAYRVVQEGLTNVIKHAGQAPASVRLSHRLGELVITVSDSGPGGSSGPAGRGLIGLRERLAIYGGSLDAGPRPGGGWRLRARVPLEAG